ncbi:MAG: CocE/NonD family hydrolase [Thermoplasmata archaeon]|nr:CocE/NonD family hydrolase [Thermoplasmata archaeon]
MVKLTAWTAILILLFPLTFSYTHEYGGDFTKKTYMVEMRDGVKLATDVYLPGDGAYPVILIRTPYNKNGTDEIMVRQIMRHGYALVVQDMRGTHASEGKFMPFLDEGWGERQDGNDTVEWILGQEWCNGKVAMWGGSAMGIAGYMLAGVRNITCMMVAIAASDMYRHAMYPGGEFRGDSLEWLKGENAEYMIPIFEEHYLYDEFWDGMNLLTRCNHVGTPIYHIGGWYDFFAEGTMDAFTALQKKDGQKLLVGPWTHGNFGVNQGDLTYPANSIFDVYGETFSWMNYWMKGDDNGIMDEKIRFYMMGECPTKYGYVPENAIGNEWWVSSSWPPRSSSLALYLHEGGMLSEARPGDEKPDFYEYDPANPAPTIGGRNLVFPAGPMRQNGVEERSDVLVYTTPPLEKPLAIAGNLTAKLWVNSTAKDTDFFVRLCDVYPDGNSILVTEGVLMARHRVGFDREDFINGICLLNISLGNTAIVFGRGHSIRVDITSSNYPAFERNPNTGDAVRKNTTYVVANNTIYHDALHPSRIILPVVEYPKIFPESGVYFGGKKIMTWKGLVIIGKMEFSVESNCSRVVFYFDNVKKYEDDEKPFSWVCDERAMGLHRLKIETYENGEMIGREKNIIIFNI